MDRSRILLADANSAVLHPEQSLGAASYVTGIHTVAERLQFEESALNDLLSANTRRCRH